VGEDGEVDILSRLMTALEFGDRHDKTHSIINEYVRAHGTCWDPAYRATGSGIREEKMMSMIFEKVYGKVKGTIVRLYSRCNERDARDGI
jgi:hypothetical protein